MVNNMKALLNKFVNKETISYAVFGVLTTAVDYVFSYIFYYKLMLSEITSNNIAWVIAVLFAYITNKLFVFDSKDVDLKTLLKEIISFAGARFVTLIITDIFLLIAANLSMDFMLAKLLISVVVIILNYFFSKLFIFNKKNN